MCFSAKLQLLPTNDELLGVIQGIALSTPKPFFKVAPLYRIIASSVSQILGGIKRHEEIDKI